MLVLTRKTKESVVIGGPKGFDRMLKVTVLEVRSGRVRLGFEVDEDVPVHRMEVWQKINSVTPKRSSAKASSLAVTERAD